MHPIEVLVNFGRYALNREAHAREDADALAELERQPLTLPRGLDIEWLGVAGYRLTYEGQTLLIDPYFTRYSLADLVRRRPMLPDPAQIDRYLPGVESVAGVLAGHAHFDHAVDIPAIARRFGAPALGSTSLHKLMRLHRLGKQATAVEPYHPYELGPFRVTFIPSEHVKLLLGLAVPYPGDITCDHLEGLTGGAYRCGQTWGIHVEVAGVSLYHCGSANLVDEAIPDGLRVDYLLAGVAGRVYTGDYWRRLLRRTDPGVVVITHHDDFFQPLDTPLAFSTNVHVAGVSDEVRRVNRDLPVAALPRVQPALPTS